MIYEEMMAVLFTQSRTDSSFSCTAVVIFTELVIGEVCISFIISVDIRSSC